MHLAVIMAETWNRWHQTYSHTLGYCLSGWPWPIFTQLVQVGLLKVKIRVNKIVNYCSSIFKQTDAPY